MTRKGKLKVSFATPKDNKVLAALGYITIVHTWLDYVLRMTVSDLAEVTKEEALDCTARQGSSELRERIRRLAKMRLGEGPPLVKLEALLHRAERATAQRNSLLHSVWGRDIDGDENFLRQPDHSFKSAPTLEELELVSAELLRIVYDIIEARLDGFLLAALKAKVGK